MAITLSELEQHLLQHCYDMSILRRDAGRKKKDSILDSLVASIIRSGTHFEEVIECMKEARSGEVLDITFFNKGGNLFSYIKPKWLNFAKALFRQRSVGLGTPNAASGEGELMFIFLSPQITKPTRGDLNIVGETIELKGEGVRVSGRISGKNFRNQTLKLLEKWNLQPNTASRTSLKACEVEKPTHREHWNSQLGKLDETSQRMFILEYLKCIDESCSQVDELFSPHLNLDALPKKIVKILYRQMVNDNLFDKFIILGDGQNAKILDNDIEKFESQVDSGEILVLSDYFRINQDAPLGWYIA
jgi:hypothetical protein